MTSCEKLIQYKYNHNVALNRKKKKKKVLHIYPKMIDEPR